MDANRPNPQPPGFTLAAVLAVMAAMLLLAVAVLAVVGIERKTARSYVDAKRAEWVAQAGLEELRGLLREQTANDDFLVIEKFKQPLVGGESDLLLDYLFLARGQGGGDELSYTLYPLFSSQERARLVNDLRDIPEIEDMVGSNPAMFRPREWGNGARVSWIPVKDEQGRIVGRYAYWVEDLQGKLPGRHSAARGQTGDGMRAEWPFPAPGVHHEYGGVAGLAFHALDPEVTGDEDTSDLDERLAEGAMLLHSPDSVLAAANFQAPLERRDDGKLDDPKARALEENVAASSLGYYERPTVPYARGISADLAGQPKLNLNALLRKERESAIDDFADHVKKGLPNFDQRKGGFPDDYVRTLAANAFDYADEDSEGTVKEGSYRGLDAYPLVSEHLVRFRWEGLSIEDGRKYLILSGTIYAEFWNMSDKPVEGEVEMSYETNYSFSVGVIPELSLGSAEFLEDPEVVSPPLTKDQGYYWLPAFNLTLEPNEYRLINCGMVNYKIDVGPASAWVSSPIVLGGDDRGSSGYRVRWNGVLVDQSRDNQIRPDTHINYPKDTKSKPRQGVWSTIPGHSYSPARFDHINNMGDPRMAYYIEVPQDPNDYPDNYSPSRRTIRWGNIYESDAKTKPKVYGRVMPSEWPDGGHNTSYGSLPSAVSAGKGRARGDERISPDDPQFFKDLPKTEPLKAPLRISNLGRFYSATELGNIYDPVMWVPTFSKGSDSTKIRSGTMPKGKNAWPDVEKASPESRQYGGGNTLRLGRPEHPRFVEPGLHAAHLLDLFHVGQAGAEDEGKLAGVLTVMGGRVNLNTATRDTLRALAVGMLGQDPALSRRASTSHQEKSLMAPLVTPLELGTPFEARAADVIADAIIRNRPFASAAELALIENQDGEPVFGNRKLYELKDKIEWSDSASEEVFARVYNSSTLRSRNFRVWVVGQAIAPLAPDSSAEPKVLAESRKVFSLFAAPWSRNEEGEIDQEDYYPIIIHENDF